MAASRTGRPALLSAGLRAKPVPTKSLTGSSRKPRKTMDARNIPAVYGTSRLSPHLHFGEISPLQCWHAMRHAMHDGRRNIDKGGTTFLKELLWREFSYHLVCNFENFMTEPFSRNSPIFHGPAMKRASRHGSAA
jgi:deoxyribodipyrimidine photo-lyase